MVTLSWSCDAFYVALVAYAFCSMNNLITYVHIVSFQVTVVLPLPVSIPVPVHSEWDCHQQTSAKKRKVGAS